MSGWESIRGVQLLCEAIRRAEPNWSATHFSELKTPRWLILNRLLRTKSPATNENQQTIAAFSNLRSRVVAAWQNWLSLAPQLNTAMSPPSTLVQTPASLGTMVVHAAVAPDQQITESDDQYNGWVEAFRKKPADIQLLVWLHMLAPRPVNDPEIERVLWNAVTVVQNSPLPFLLRAQLTLRAYQNIPSIPIPPVTIATSEGRGHKSVGELAALAVKGGVGEYWNRSLWETKAFASTSESVKTEITNYLVERKIKAPESERVYELLAKLDTQNKHQKPFVDGQAVLSYMIHITHILQELDPRTNVVGPLVTEFGRPMSQSLNNEIIHLAQILHLHSLMTVAQIRRAAASFWTLTYALSILT